MTGPVLLNIDEPADRVFRTSVCRVRGWYGSADSATMGTLELRIGDARVTWQVEARPDVSDNHPNLWITGFHFDLDVGQHLYAIRSGELVVTFIVPTAPEVQMQFSVLNSVTSNCLARAAW